MRHSLRPRAAQIRFICGLLTGAVLVLCMTPGGRAESAATKRTAAKAQFERAEKQRTALLDKPQKLRTLEEYAAVVAAYRRIYLITPHAAEVPVALMTVGDLYLNMGRQFNAKYFQSAIDAYQFLLHEYPTSRLRKDALLAIARIQQEDLEQPALATKTYQEFLKLYPRSAKAAEARDSLARMAESPAPEREAAARPQPAAQQEAQRKLPQVTRIRAWNAENYTRIVVDVEDHVEYRAARISDPDRIYFDLHKAKLNSTLAGKPVEVEGGFLKTVRVAQNQAGVVRVVLEVNKVKDYSVFLLSNPYRLVVDVYGEAPVVARSAPPSAPEPEKGAKPSPGREKSEPARKEKPAAKSSTAEIAKRESARSEAEKPASGRSTPEKPAGKRGKSKSQDTETARAKAPEPEREAAEKPARRRSSKSTREVAKLTPPPVPQPNKNGQRSLTRALGLKIGRIVIDPGHGGQDTGTIGPTGLMEKDLCLDIALRLGKIIQQRLAGAEVIYTREDDTFIPLENRTAIANQAKADLFISIHANSSRDHKARGVETYYLNFSASADAMEVASRENALYQGSIHELQDLIKKIARNEKIEESRELAADIQDALSRRLQRVTRTNKNRGVRKAPFVVLIGANMPSVLSEVSFLSNPADEQMLKKPEHRQRVAEGLYHGVENYLQSINSLTYNQPKPALATH